jgi:hypothetical protein
MLSLNIQKQQFNMHPHQYAYNIYIFQNENVILTDH